MGVFLRAVACTPLILATYALGCSTTEPAADEAKEKRPAIDAQAADPELDAQLKDLKEFWIACQASGECPSGETTSFTSTAHTDDGVDEESGALKVADVGGESELHPNAWNWVFEKFTKPGVCGVLFALRDWKRPYFYTGASISASLGAGLTGGADIVWDLWNRQSAALFFIGTSAEKGIGASLELYMGVGVTKQEKSSVLEAWSGPFVARAIEFPVPLLPPKVFKGTASTFASVPPGVYGGSVGLKAGAKLPFEFPGLPKKVGTINGAAWAPFDAATTQLQAFQKLGSLVDVQNPSGKVIQYANGDEVAKSILKSVLPPFSVIAALGALGYGRLRDKNYSFESYCQNVAPKAPRQLTNQMTLPAMK
jgi:hypothetical protein